jgi:hypothetical protein
MRCWYSRWQLSNALDRGELESAVANGHSASCTRCQAYARSLQALHGKLLDGAAFAPEPVAGSRRRLMLVAPLVLAGAAAAAVALAVGPASEPPHESVATVPTPAFDNARVIANRVTKAITSDRNPLDAELEAIAADGRRGLNAALLGFRD